MNAPTPTVIKTLSVRLKDRHAEVLDRKATEVNRAWNVANEMAYEAWYVPVPGVGWIQGVWRSVFDIQKAMAGINKQRSWMIGSAVTQKVIAVHGA